MSSIPPIGIIASIAEYRGFEDSTKALDPHHEISLAKTFSIQDPDFTIHSCRLKHRKVLTQIYSKGHLLFEAIDYHVTKNDLHAQQVLSKALLNAFQAVNVKKLAISNPALTHFAIAEAIVNSREEPGKRWGTVSGTNMEAGEGADKLSFTIGLSLFDDAYIEVNYKSSSVFSGETLFGGAKIQLDESHLARIHKIHESLMR